jgi:hypothetical protein
VITRLEVYSDSAIPEWSGGPVKPTDTLLFTDAGKAEDVRRALLEDDGLAGITRIEVVTVPTDDDAVIDFYVRTATDPAVVPLAAEPLTEDGALEAALILWRDRTGRSDHPGGDDTPAFQAALRDVRRAAGEEVA